MKPHGPHKSARYRTTADLYRRHGSVRAVADATGLPVESVTQDLWRARRNGILPPVTHDVARWVEETARISDLTIGTRGDLLDALGVDMVKRIAAECPQGVPLMVYIAGIVKDSYDDTV